MISSQKIVWLVFLCVKQLLCETWDAQKVCDFTDVSSTQTVLKTQEHRMHPSPWLHTSALSTDERWVRRLKLCTLKRFLKKWDHILRRQEGSHRLFTSQCGKKKNTKPRWSANWIKITNVQFLEWVKQLMMLKLYRSSKADGQHMERLERSLQMCVSASPSGTGAITQNQRESWKLPRSPVTPFIQATYLSPLSSCTALKTPLASPTESS